MEPIDIASSALRNSCTELHGHRSIPAVNDGADNPYPVIMDLYDHAIKAMENENA